MDETTIPATPEDEALESDAVDAVPDESEPEMPEDAEDE